MPPKKNQVKSWEVEKIIKIRVEKGERQYLTVWKNFPLGASSWEPKESFICVQDLIDVYKQDREARGTYRKWLWMTGQTREQEPTLTGKPVTPGRDAGYSRDKALQQPIFEEKPNFFVNKTTQKVTETPRPVPSHRIEGQDHFRATERPIFQVEQTGIQPRMTHTQLEGIPSGEPHSQTSQTRTTRTQLLIQEGRPSKTYDFGMRRKVSKKARDEEGKFSAKSVGRTHRAPTLVSRKHSAVSVHAHNEEEDEEDRLRRKMKRYVRAVYDPSSDEEEEPEDEAKIFEMLQEKLAKDGRKEKLTDKRKEKIRGRVLRSKERDAARLVRIWTAVKKGLMETSEVADYFKEATKSYSQVKQLRQIYIDYTMKNLYESVAGPCVFCSGHPDSLVCTVKKYYEERKEFLEEKKRCTKCMKKNCTQDHDKLSCMLCQKSGDHHMVMCPQNVTHSGFFIKYA